MENMKMDDREAEEFGEGETAEENVVEEQDSEKTTMTYLS